MSRSIVAALAAGVCVVALATQAQAQAQTQTQTQTQDYRIPAGSLKAALDAYARQSGRQVIYKVDEVRSARSRGATGAMTATAALDAILAGSGFGSRTDPSGAVAIVRAAETSKSAGEAEAADAGEEIVVTGTNIRGVAPAGSKVDTYSRADLERSGFSSVTEFVKSLPANLGDLGSDTSGLPSDTRAGNSGGSGVNLRGLGSDATLVLLNGHRLAPAGIGGRFVDVSVLPIGMIERVEILTDGGSAVYGSDAVAGVVNYVLRRDFTGFEVSSRYNLATRGAGDQVSADALAGFGWADGNLTIGGNYNRQQDIKSTDRSFSDNVSEFDLVPRSEQYSITAVATQEIGSKTTLSLDALYSRRDTHSNNLSGTTPLPTDLDTKQLSISSTLTHDISPGWSSTLTATYGNNVSSIVNSFGPQRTKSQQYIGDVILSGRLLTLPAGPVRLAVGGQIRKEEFARHLGGVFAAAGSNFSTSRDVYAGFGEIYVPLFSDANSTPFFRVLEFNLSGRYEHYSSFGSAFNPKFGVTWKPANDLTLRGSIGRSFKAPEFVDLYESINSILLNAPDANSPTGFSPTLLVRGGNPDLTVQRSRTWTVGFDVTPSSMHGFRFSGTYFNTRFTDRIAEPATALIRCLDREFDGWILHAAATPESVAVLAPLVAETGARWMAWVKGFAAFKRNVSVAYAWEPVIVKPARKPVVSKRLVLRDWVQESIALRRGLTGAKPEAVCHWAFEVVGARPDDELVDLYPGTGAVTRAWATWCGKFVLPRDVASGRDGQPIGSGR